ncbi:MAG: hypothetical protein OQK76_09835 [Gammaproteobacteria bacterium]|nr:hypothetical protein [Gammaproteobacteria bacterium]MCW8910902.1 hypothetical protein [Gammaproteobacteria bacterium]MCW9004592.1 hypothetical protein [Gammaproteobacteria bacterium]MCW9056716.1 hypothetical protein [Gammaproteobacteria bacterium]
MKLQLNSTPVKIAAASSFVLLGSIIAAVLHSTSSNVQVQASVEHEEIRNKPRQLTPQELDDMHSSWIFSSSESAALVDNDSGFETATIGR